jgi:hypothetical protein
MAPNIQEHGRIFASTADLAAEALYIANLRTQAAQSTHIGEPRVTDDGEVVESI